MSDFYVQDRRMSELKGPFVFSPLPPSLPPCSHSLSLSPPSTLFFFAPLLWIA